MRLIVYSVIVQYVDDILASDLDQIFPSAESAIRHAKKIASSPSVFCVEVLRTEVTEEYGMHSVARVYREEHKEHYYND